QRAAGRTSTAPGWRSGVAGLLPPADRNLLGPGWKNGPFPGSWVGRTGDALPAARYNVDLALPARASLSPAEEKGDHFPLRRRPSCIVPPAVEVIPCRRLPPTSCVACAARSLLRESSRATAICCSASSTRVTRRCSPP